jgi:ferredoxin
MPFLELMIDRIACTGHGACSELLPGLIDSDEWGYPIIIDSKIPVAREREARHAVAMCPVLAIRLKAVVS